jgi:hypothetical protein
VVLVCALCTSSALAACGGSGATPDATVADVAPPLDTTIDADDGTPVRRPCTSQFGSALTQMYGRLDGTLVAIVPPGTGPCNADRDHVHLQIEMNGAVYDVAVNVGDSNMDDVKTVTKDIALPVWQEGWHTGVLEDYVSLGVHSTELTLGTRTEIADALMTDLATVNHISVFGTAYGPDGAHLIHRNGQGHDGLLVTQPLSVPAHVRLFSFTTQAF